MAFYSSRISVAIYRYGVVAERIREVIIAMNALIYMYLSIGHFDQMLLSLMPEIN